MAITKVITPDLIDLKNSQLASGVATTYVVTVVAVTGVGNRYFVNGVQAPNIVLIPGTQYIINQDDASNAVGGSAPHPIVLSTTIGTGGAYSTGVVFSLDGTTVSETVYRTNASFVAATQRRITITLSSPPTTLYYICWYHQNMGNTVITVGGALNTDGIVLAKGTTGPTVDVEYLVVAGGGGGGGKAGGGGGAGGYLSNYGGTKLNVDVATNLIVTIGAGGGGGGLGARGGSGSNSIFSIIDSSGGGGGGYYVNVSGLSGGSGGGGGAGSTPGGSGGSATPSGQGFNGGTGQGVNQSAAGGGGGASEVGVSPSVSGVSADGGDGLQNNIDGNNYFYAGGGGGSANNTYNGAGGNGGGGTGGTNSIQAIAGTDARGGGGGGGAYDNTGRAGGKGIIILRTSSSTTAVFSGGVTANGSTGGSIAPDTSTGDNVWIITATTNSTQTVTFSSTAPSTGRPTTNLSDGEFRYNTTTKKVEFYDGAEWFALISSPALPQAGTTGTCNYPTTATALYQLNSGVGSNVPDTCGTYNGTATSITYSTGNFGNAAIFNGSSSGIVLPSSLNTNVIDATGAFSISMWINTNSLSAIQYLFCASVSNNIDVSINGNNQGVGKIIWTIWDGTYSYLTSTTTITTNAWYHIVATYNNGSRELFINSASQGTSTKTLVESSTEPTLGYRTGSGSSERFDGGMDQLRIFPSALTQEQVSALYTETVP